jgi:hypothetical protein
MVRVKALSFNDWWNEPGTWSGNPMREIFEWIEEERGMRNRRVACSGS